MSMKYINYKSGVYGIYNTLGKCVYIGCTKNFDTRYKQHLKMLFDKNHHNSLLNNYVEKFGIQKLVFREIKQCPEKEINYWEMFFIKLLNPLCNGNDKQYLKLNDDDDQEIFYRLYEKYKGKRVTILEILECDDFKQISPKRLGMIFKKNNIKKLRLGERRIVFYEL